MRDEQEGSECTREELDARLERCKLYEEGTHRAGWYRGLKKRFESAALKIKKPEAISAKRLKVTEADVTQWFYDRWEYFVEKYLTDIIADASRMFNIDETFVKFSDTKGYVLTCEKPGERKHCFKQQSGVGDKGGITSVILVNAQGDAVEPMIILKRDRLNESSFVNQFKDAEGNPLRFTVAKTDSGWISVKILYE